MNWLFESYSMICHLRFTWSSVILMRHVFMHLKCLSYLYVHVLDIHSVTLFSHCWFTFGEINIFFSESKLLSLCIFSFRILKGLWIWKVTCQDPYLQIEAQIDKNLKRFITMIDILERKSKVKSAFSEFNSYV